VHETDPRKHAVSFLRSVLLLVFAMAGLLVLQAAFDTLAGVPLRGLGRFDVRDAMHFNNLLSRNLNQLVAVVFTTVAIAVPLTANMYSLRFLEFFVKDPVNAAVLLFVVFTDVTNSWAGYRMRDGAVPVVQLHLLFVFTVLCFAILFPYLYYIFRFLHPSTLLSRLERDVVEGVEVARRDPLKGRGQVAANLEHLTNVAVRSLERGDRNPALESVDALARVLRRYWELKPGLTEVWLVPDPRHFLGFSTAALEELRTSGTWVEMKVYSQLYQIVGAAIGRQPDLTATAAKTLRKLGQEGSARADEGVRELTVEYFNTLLRLALNRRDARSVFAILDQYRLFADSLNLEFPALGEEIAYYLAYYGQVAREMNLTFISEAAAYDLATLVRSAWQAQAPNRHRLLESFLRYGEDGKAPMKGVHKAQAILASFFALHGENDALEAVRGAWRELSPAFVSQVRNELLAVTREKYWEVSDRRLNLDFVPDAQRVKLGEFFASLVAARQGAPSA